MKSISLTRKMMQMWKQVLLKIKMKTIKFMYRRAIKRCVENMVNNNLDLEAGDDEQLVNEVEHRDENDSIRNAFEDLFQ